MKQLHMRTINTATPFIHSDRSGVTLMEVLMSVMIMSIGVVSLASLFPVSILRGVQATKLTNATVLRYNAEALIDAFPLPFVFDPDGTLNANGHIAHQRRNRNYIVDPLGSYYATLDGTGLEASFGNDGTGGAVTRIPRFHAGLTTQLSAVNFFTQQDSWNLLYEGVPTSLPNSPTFPGGINSTRDTIFIDTTDITSGIVDLTELSATVSGLTGGRILIYDTTGKQVQVRIITGANINAGAAEISFADPLPNNGLYDSISKIRIETLEQRYSYLLTVRRQIASDVASVDVVVFFRRNFSPEFEALHSTTNFVSQWLPGPDGDWGVSGVDDDGDGTTDERLGEQGWPGSDDFQNRSFTLHFNTNVDKPLLKKGGYVFDAINARWYRIQRIENESSISADLTLDQPIIGSINSAGSPLTLTPGIIVMPNVVQVYPLGNKTR